MSAPTTLWILVDPTAGNNAHDVVNAMLDLARRLGCGVRSNINGLIFSVNPEESRTAIWARYEIDMVMFLTSKESTS